MVHFASNRKVPAKIWDLNRKYTDEIMIHPETNGEFTNSIWAYDQTFFPSIEVKFLFILNNYSRLLDIPVFLYCGPYFALIFIT